MQVKDLQLKLKLLGGSVNQRSSACTSVCEILQGASSGRSISDLEIENVNYRERTQMLEEEIHQLQYVSANVRRCISSLVALISVPLGKFKEDLLLRLVLVNMTAWLQCTSLCVYFPVQ